MLGKQIERKQLTFCINTFDLKLKVLIIKHTLGEFFFKQFPQLIRSDYYQIVRFLEEYYAIGSIKPIITDQDNSILRYIELKAENQVII